MFINPQKKNKNTAISCHALKEMSFVIRPFRPDVAPSWEEMNLDFGNKLKLRNQGTPDHFGSFFLETMKNPQYPFDCPIGFEDLYRAFYNVTLHHQSGMLLATLCSSLESHRNFVISLSFNEAEIFIATFRQSLILLRDSMMFFFRTYYFNVTLKDDPHRPISENDAQVYWVQKEMESLHTELHTAHPEIYPSLLSDDKRKEREVVARARCGQLKTQNLDMTHAARIVYDVPYPDGSAPAVATFLPAHTPVLFTGQRLMVGDVDSDTHLLCLSIDGHEFVVTRRCLLECNSSYFESFLRSGLKMHEKDTLVMEIGGISPVLAEAFVKFLMSGVIGKISPTLYEDANCDRFMNLITFAVLGHRCDIPILFLGSMGKLRQLLLEDMQPSTGEDAEDGDGDGDGDDDDASPSSNHRKRRASDISQTSHSLENFAAFQVLFALDSGTFCVGPAVESGLWKIILECLRLPVVVSRLYTSSTIMQSSPSPSKHAKTSSKTDENTKLGKVSFGPKMYPATNIESLIDLFDPENVSVSLLTEMVARRGDCSKIKTTEFALLLVSHPEIKDLSTNTLSHLMFSTGSKNLQILMEMHSTFVEHVDWIREHHIELEAKDERLMSDVLTRLDWILSKDPNRPRWDFGMTFTTGGRADSKTEYSLLSKLSETRTFILNQYQSVTGSSCDGVGDGGGGGGGGGTGTTSDSDSYEYPSSYSSDESDADECP